MLHAELRELCATLFEGGTADALAPDAAASGSDGTGSPGAARKAELLQALYRDNREVMELGRAPQI